MDSELKEKERFLHQQEALRKYPKFTKERIVSRTGDLTRAEISKLYQDGYTIKHGKIKRIK